MLGLAREKIPAYATARNIEPTPEDVFKEAAERKAQGYHAFKIQFWDGLDRDIPRFRAAREAVGDDYPLMQDAAGMYTLLRRRSRPARSWASSTTMVRGADPGPEPVPAPAS